MLAQLGDEFDHVAAGNVEFLGEVIEGWPGVAFPACKVGQVRVEFLGLLRDFRTFFEPLWQPNTVKKAVRIDKFSAARSAILTRKSLRLGSEMGSVFGGFWWIFLSIFTKH